MGFKEVRIVAGSGFGNRTRFPIHRVNAGRLVYIPAFLLGTTLVLTPSVGCSPSGTTAKGGSGSTSASGTPRAHKDLPPIASLNDANGFFDTASKTAAFVDKPTEKAAVLLEIAEARMKSGDAAGAKQTATQLAQYASGLPASDPNTTEVVLPLLAEAQAAVGDLAAARKTAGSIKDDQGQSDAWSRVVAAQAATGDISGALKTIGKAKFTVAAHQYAALSSIVMEAAVRGDRRGADLVSRYVESHWRPKVYADAADGLHKRGDTDAAQQMLQKALAAVDGIHDPKNPSYESANRTEALITIAQVQSTWGDQPSARKTLQRAYQTAGKIGLDSTGQWDLRNDVVGHLVTNLIQVGDKATAQAAASTIKDSMTRVAYLDSVKTGKPIITPDMENASGAPVVSPIVVQARKGDLAGAKTNLEDVQDPAQRAVILAQIGESLQHGAGK